MNLFGTVATFVAKIWQWLVSGITGFCTFFGSARRWIVGKFLNDARFGALALFGVGGTSLYALTSFFGEFVKRLTGLGDLDFAIQSFDNVGAWSFVSLIIPWDKICEMVVWTIGIWFLKVKVANFVFATRTIGGLIGKVAGRS